MLKPQSSSSSSTWHYYEIINKNKEIAEEM